MPGPGAPLGNKNAASARRWRAALEWALAHAYEPDAINKVISSERALYTIAQRIVKAALDDQETSGEDMDAVIRILGVNVQKWKFAVEEIGNRLDGKPSQSIALSGDGEGSPIDTRLTVEFVRARDAN